jgi:hypothetical protein
VPQVKIRPGASDEEIIPATTKWTRTREVGKMRRARITVPRADANAVTLNEKEDDIELVGVDTLRLVDVETGGPTHTLVCYSHEWLANTVTPTDGGTLRQGSDADLVNGWINDVPQWTAGTITQQATGLSFVFNHAAPHEGLRRIEKNVPGEILFRDTGIVDYVNQIGGDKTESVTLSSANQNIEDEITITKRGRELDGTHIRVLGAHEGEAQFFANLVPSDDPATYENRVDYSTSRWSDGDTRDWDRFVNKDVTDQATVEEAAAELGTEITDRLVEAEATTTLDLDVGDTVQVTKADGDLDREMRVHRIKEEAKGGTVKRKLLLSTRTIVRADESKDLRDIQRFNSGFQGDSIVQMGGPVIAGVDSGKPLKIPFRYPDIEFENTAELFVQGLEYRVDADPNPHDHDVTVTHPSHRHDVTHPTHEHDLNFTTAAVPEQQSVSYYNSAGSDTISSGGVATTVDSYSFGSNEDGFPYVLKAELGVDPSATNEIENAALFGDDGTIFYFMIDDAGLDKRSAIPQNGTVLSGRDLRNETMDLKLRVDTDDGNSIDCHWAWDITGIPQHAHDINSTSDTALGTNETSTAALGTTETSTSDTEPGFTAGINETGDTPTGVDVLIDGNTVASDIGSGTFQTIIDVGGDMTPGTWHTIEFQSDTLGRIMSAVFISGYEKVGTQ